MAVYFVDTSALAKRYLNEMGTRWVRSWIRPGARNTIIIAELAMVEMFSFIARHEFEGDITSSSARRRREVFLYHATNNYGVMSITSETFNDSRDLVTRHVGLGLRTLDAIQLACAITARNILGVPIIFVSADDKLLRSAAAEGFTIDNPKLHP